jgi:hypothetical protein
MKFKIQTRKENENISKVDCVSNRRRLGAGLPLKAVPPTRRRWGAGGQ